MGEYRAITSRGMDLEAAGVNEALIKEYETLRITVDGAQAEARLLQRHPDATEIRDRIAEVIAKDPQSFLGAPSDLALEAAYSMAKAEPTPEPGAHGYGGHGIEALAAQRQRAREVDEYIKTTGDRLGAARAIHPGFADHPDIPRDPRR